MPVIGVMRRGGHIQCSAPCHALSVVLTLSQWRIPSRKEKKERAVALFRLLLRDEVHPLEDVPGFDVSDL